MCVTAGGSPPQEAKTSEVLALGEYDIRPLKPEELTAASQLCLRSKAFWGYGKAFMDACVEELSLTQHDLDHDQVFCAARGEELLGVAQLTFSEGELFLEKMFVDPKSVRQGVGDRLYKHVLNMAAASDAKEIVIESDPYAVDFYLGQGAKRAGETPSLSIPDRVLPRLVHKLAH